MLLNQYRANITSQHGENGILAYLIRSFPAIPRTCLEVGASDGLENSNTYPLWISGWRALLIEGGAKAYRRLQSNSAGYNVTTCNDLIEPTGTQSLDAIATNHGFDEFGIASIDIDSCDYWIFAHLQTRPAIVIIECNPDFPIRVSYHDPEGPSLLRHSARAVAELGVRKGYRAIACTGPNVILMRGDMIATNPDAVPNVPLHMLEDSAYAAGRSQWIVGAKPFSYRPVYKRPPNPAVRAYFEMRAAGLSARAWLKGKGGSLGSISDTHRRHIEAHGLQL